MSASVTTDGALLGGRLGFEQPARGYRAAIDPVLLAAAVGLARGLVLDLGSGAGAAGLCLARRVPGIRVVGLELDPVVAAIASRNAVRNGLADRVAVEIGDAARLPRAWLGTFDAVITNPPFGAAGRGTASPDPARRRAMHEHGVGLEAWLRAAHRALKPRGRLMVIHRADRLADILAALGARFGDVEVIGLWPRLGVSAKRVIVRARRDVRGPTTLRAGLVLHEASGAFTAAAERVLRGGEGLDAVLAPAAA